MAAAPRSFNSLILALLAGGATLALVALLRSPHDAPVTPATTTGGAASNQLAVAERSTSPRFNRVRRPRAAAAEIPAPGNTDFAKAQAVLKDEAASLQARRQAAFDLVRMGTDEALDALRLSLPSLPPLVKAAAADALGFSKNPRATEVLLSMWPEADDITLRPIATGLGRQGCPECLAALRAVLLDPARTTQARGDAAAGLGVATDAESLLVLKGAFAAIQDPELRSQLLTALGERPFKDTRELIQQVLDAPDSTPEFRLAALESLSDLPAEASPFLAKYLFDADADIRSEAAWALSTTETPGNAGPQILSLLVNEQDAGVRLRLFQALSNQEGFDVNAALHLTQAETDPAVRLAAYESLVGLDESQSTPELRAYFDQTMVPALVPEAQQGKDLSGRLQAVMLLQQIDSPAAQQALAALQQTVTEETVLRALRGTR
jgi:HEAT repeat protein